MRDADTEALIVKKITLGTRRQYAEKSKAWKHGERSEDQLLQRIWNLADDSVALIDFIAGLVAEKDEWIEAAAKNGADLESALARVEQLEAALRDLIVAVEKGGKYRLFRGIAAARATLGEPE